MYVVYRAHTYSTSLIIHRYIAVYVHVAYVYYMVSGNLAMLNFMFTT